LPSLDEKQIVVDDELPAHLGDQATPVLQKYPWLDWLIPAALCAVLLGQLLFSVRQLSQEWDEAVHLYSGYRALKCGDFTVSPEHPPLAKVIAAATLVPMNFAVNCAPVEPNDLQQAFVTFNWFYGQNWPAALARARMAVSVFAVGLCLLVWITARRMFGLTTAVVASLLLIFEPNVLAYGALVLTDVPVTCMLLLAVLGFYLWVRHRTAPLLLLTGLATGLTLLSKNSGMAVVPILGALAITDALTQPGSDRPRWKLALRNLLALALIGALAVGIVWACYGILFAAHPAVPQLQQPRPPATSAFRRFLRLLLPQPYLGGFGMALAISDRGSVMAFVAGKIYLHAPWFSTPLNFLIRSTPAMLAMILAAAFGVARTIRQRRRERLFVLVPMAVYLAVCSYATINAPVRYLLPMFPFLLIAVADGCVELARRVRWVSYGLPCLLVLHAASSLHAYPNYLSYANDLWGGPSQAYKYESWLDLGQAYPEARAYLQQHPAQNCWLITGWQWDPGFYNLPCQTFGLYLTHEIPPRVHGTVIVSSTLLTDVRIQEEELAAAFKNATPKDQIGGSALLVYEGDFDTSLDAATGERNLATQAALAGQLSAALEHAKRAVELAPASAMAHRNLCMLMADNRVDSALEECNTARNLFLNDPFRDESGRKYYLSSVDRCLTALKR